MNDEEKENKKFTRIQKIVFPLGIGVFVAGVAISLFILNDASIPNELAGILGGLYIAVGISTVFLTIASISNHDIMLKLINIEKKLNISNELNNDQDLEVKQEKEKISDKDIKTYDWKHPKLANTTTAVLLGIVFTLVIWNVWSSYAESIKEYNFPALEILKPITLTAYQTYTDGSRDLIYNQTKPAYLNVSYQTTSLSALNPIIVKATLDVRNVNDTEWKAMPPIHILTFPGSYIYSDDWNFQDNAPIVLEKVPNLHQYAGKQTIVFPFAGDYRFAVLSLDDASDVKVSRDGKYTVSKAVFTNIDKKVLENSKIVIEPSSSATTVKLANLGQALVWILIGIGTLQLRKQIIRGVTWIANL